MKRRDIATSMCALALTLAAAAMAQQVETTVDRTADFSKYRTFTIEVATSWGNPIGEKHLLEELTNAFTAKGWENTQASPDVHILVHGATKEKQRLDTFYTGGYGGFYGGWGWGGVGSSTTTVSEYTEGTLVLDIFDAKTKTLVWRGVAQDELKVKQNKREKQAAKAIAKLLRDFPPKPSAG